MSLLAKSGGGWVGPWHPVSVAWYLGASGSLEVVGSGEREGTGFSVLRVSHLSKYWSDGGSSSLPEVVKWHACL